MVFAAQLGHETGRFRRRLLPHPFNDEFKGWTPASAGVTGPDAGVTGWLKGKLTGYF